MIIKYKLSAGHSTGVDHAVQALLDKHARHYDGWQMPGPINVVMVARGGTSFIATTTIVMEVS